MKHALQFNPCPTTNQRHSTQHTVHVALQGVKTVSLSKTIFFGTEGCKGGGGS